MLFVSYRSTLLFLLLVVGFLCACSARSDETPQVSFDLEVRPIFVAKCIACHGGVQQSGGLSLVYEQTLLGKSDSGKSILPGDSESSYLIERIADPDPDSRMPPPEHGEALSPQEIETISRWIDQGARWELPWGYKRPEQPSWPKIDKNLESLWAQNEIDSYVLAKLRSLGLKPSPANQREQQEQWLRRVSFDLTGLPPTQNEVQSFLSDSAPTSIAKQRVVDRLLDSPRFGERWASLWLDLARYADTMGFEKDLQRDIWPYRDWVIRSFNKDKPYDRFLLEQLAGDLLPEATLDQRLATAFHRNTQTNAEGGTDDEEFRVSAIIDRVDTTWQAMQGLTFGCARCHDHPYDPISQADYYSVFACLNSTQDADLKEDYPKLRVPIDQAQWEESNRLDREIASLREWLYHQGYELAQKQTEWLGMQINEVTSNGTAEFEVQPIEESINGSASDGDEIQVRGTIVDNSRYSVRASAITGPIRALRIDALPQNIETAAHTPEMGFVVSRIRVFLERAHDPSDPQELFFQAAFCDEPAPFFAAENSLKDNSAGWAAYSRLWRPRWALFVLDEELNGPLELQEADQLRIEIKQSKNLDGQDALALRRFRLSISPDLQWQELVADKEYTSALERLDKLQKKQNRIPATRTPCMVDRPADLQRENRLFDRGNWLVKSERVAPRIPAVFGIEQEDLAEIPSRLQLAQWIASEKNPLTAKVWVNRVWSELFGQGLVESLEDFGSTGSRPSHPELLDYLATSFVEQDKWQLKPLLRRIVLSSTYGQEAKASTWQLEQDPRNMLLARGPRSRLRAEMVRDQALVLSGHFNPQPFGPPVMPYQPEGIWNSVYSNAKWNNAQDENRFRRAIYIYWKRTAGYPSLLAFDAPSREQCTAFRPTTNTPVQALVTMNDPAYVELAECFAERMLRREGTTRERIAWAYSAATSSRAPDNAIDSLLSLYAHALKSRELEEKEAKAFAMTIVASAIMNLDATLSK